MNRLKVWCDFCGDLINEDEENSCVIYKPIHGDTLVFCNSDHMDEFMTEYIFDAYIDYQGRLIED